MAAPNSRVLDILALGPITVTTSGEFRERTHVLRLNHAAFPAGKKRGDLAIVRHGASRPRKKPDGRDRVTLVAHRFGYAADLSRELSERGPDEAVRTTLAPPTYAVHTRS